MTEGFWAVSGGSIDPINEADLQDSLDLQERLNQRFRALLAPPNLTPRQFGVVSLIMEGHTQHAAAKALGVNQSTIAKTLLGNTVYKGTGKHYGGVGKKILQTLLHDPIIKQLCLSIYTFDNRGMVYHLCRTAFTSHEQFIQWLEGSEPPPEASPTPLTTKQVADKRYYWKHREECAQRARDYYQKNKEKCSSNAKAYYQKRLADKKKAPTGFPAEAISQSNSFRTK